jgi:hypothetical protein
MISLNIRQFLTFASTPSASHRDAFVSNIRFRYLLLHPTREDGCTNHRQIFFRSLHILLASLYRILALFTPHFPRIDE